MLLLQLESVFMSRAQVAIKIQADVHGLGHHLKACVCMSEGHAATGGHDDCSVLLPEDIMTSRHMLLPGVISGLIHDSITARVCVDVRGPCYHQRPCGCPWSGLRPEIILMSKPCTFLALALDCYHNHVQES